MGPPGREAEAEDAAASDRAPFRVSSCGDTTPFDHDRFARMRAHAAFVPTLVLERLAADPHAPAEPYETSFPAAVMFVDIAGYVRLSGATHRGVARRETRMETQSRGLRRKSSGRWRRGEKEGDDDPGSRVAGLAGEAMRDVVSACFAAIVEIVSRHGGDVVKFAGDALFVAWPAGKDRLVDRRREEKESDLNRNRNRNRNRDETPSFETETYDETLGETALRAVQCGLAIQACAREHEAFEGLQLKLVIGAGRARGVNVGGVDDRWEYAIAGEPVTQIARCAPFAAPGEVVVSPECARLEEMQDHAETTLVCQKDGGHVAGSEEDAESDESSFEDAADPPDGTADRPRSEYVSSILRAETSASLRGRAGSGGAFRFPSARLLFAGALRLGAFAGDNSSSAAGAPKAPRRAESARGGGDGASNRGSLRASRTPEEVPLRVARLTNGFDGATVAAAAPPRPSADRDAMLRDVFSFPRKRVNGDTKNSNPDPAGSAEALVKALERYVPAPARVLGFSAEAPRERRGAPRVNRCAPRLYDTAWRGEIRRCAVVFLDARLPEIREDVFDQRRDDVFETSVQNDIQNDPKGSSDSLRHAQTAVATTQRVLKTHGGALRQFLVDDKGSVAIAVFGLPSMSHADDAARAVAFAAETIDALETRGLPGARAGVATGDAFCGAVGPETRCEYAVYGECVNVAARLMTARGASIFFQDGFPDSRLATTRRVLVCEATRVACGDAVAFDEGTPLKLKGMRGLARAFSPLRLGETRLGETDATTEPSDRDRDRNRNRFRFASREPQRRRGDATGPRRSRASARDDLDALEPRVKRLAVTAAALLDAFDAETLLAAADGVADSSGGAQKKNYQNVFARKTKKTHDAATREEDVLAAIRAGIFRVVRPTDSGVQSPLPAGRGGSRRFADALSSDSAGTDAEDDPSEDESSASEDSETSTSRVTVSFVSGAFDDKKKNENENEKTFEKTQKGLGDFPSLAFASARVRDAALRMLTDAARRPANRAVAALLESRADEETRNSLKTMRGLPPSARRADAASLACSSSFLAKVAAHWTAAGRRARARRCLALAGEKELARGTRGGAARAEGLFAEAMKLCEPPSPSERRETKTTRDAYETETDARKRRRKRRLRREAFLARRVGAARRAAGFGDDAERLVRGAIEKLERAEEDTRREGCAFLFLCAAAPASCVSRRGGSDGRTGTRRARDTKKTQNSFDEAPRRRRVFASARQTASSEDSGDVYPSSSTSSSSCDSVEADAELALARLALFEITGETKDAACAVRAAEECEAASELIFFRRSASENRRDALRDARRAVAENKKNARVFPTAFLCRSRGS